MDPAIKLMIWTLRLNAFAAVLGALVSIVSGADLADYGAVYDDNSPEAVAQNDRAVERLIAKLPDSGGGIDLRCGNLTLGKPIKYPHRIFNGSPRPIPFYVRGQPGAWVWMKMADKGAAILIEPNYPGQYRGGYARFECSGFTLVDGGVKVTAGGKFTTVRDMNVVGADVGYDVKHFDGGGFAGLVNAYSCQVGARFDTCMHLQFDRFICRENETTGLIATNCADWFGSIYCESNKGLQADLNGLSRSRLAVWFEDRPGGGNRSLVKLRECTYNEISGVVQENCADADPISRALTRFVSDERNWPSIGEPVGTAKDFAAYSGVPLFTQDGLSIVCKPNCLGQNVLLQGEIRGFDPTNSYAFKAGDWFQLDADLKVSPDVLKFVGAETPFMLSFGAGQPAVKKNVRLEGEQTHIRAVGKATADGKGLRLFVTMLLRRNNTEELRFDLSNVTVRHKPN